ncbi:MAG: class I SAM-dependent methyltransferase [Kiritimatiellae bacterium]|nr:class I SAM-dependent methyltransferase [Kiritimatiellia bacterium]
MRARPTAFVDSERFWVELYERGGNSGSGSYGKLAEFKAEFLNRWVRDHDIQAIMEFGCGDGNQLRLAAYPSYTGFDVSPRAVAMCREQFANDKAKSFRLVSEYDGERAQLVLSLDVLYHLIEDAAFTEYMHRLFASADVFVIIYSSNSDVGQAEGMPEVKRRRFTDWIDVNAPDWTLVNKTPNRHPFSGDAKTGSQSDFYVYQRQKDGWLRSRHGRVQRSW